MGYEEVKEVLSELKFTHNMQEIELPSTRVCMVGGKSERGPRLRVYTVGHGIAAVLSSSLGKRLLAIELYDDGKVQNESVWYTEIPDYQAALVKRSLRAALKTKEW